MIGETISHYRVIGKIGEGGMGVVYLAEHTLLGRRVAIKTISANRDSQDQHFRSRFLREAQAVSKLSHPNIATVYDYGETDSGQPYIVMELIEGQTLADLMRAEALTIDRALEIIKQVAEALGEAHGHGIVHRDIKPSNIALNTRGVVKVLDFGLAKQVVSTSPVSPELAQPEAVATQTREDVRLGTPLYMSPEQALGLSVDGRSDLFSLGSVLYESIAGRPAFAGRSDIEIYAKIIRDNPVPPSEFNGQVTQRLDGITLKALAKRPEDRWQSAADFVIELSQAEQLLPFTDNGAASLASAPAASDSVLHRPISQGGKSISSSLSGPWTRIRYLGLIAILIGVTALLIWQWRKVWPHTYQPSPAAQRYFELGSADMREGAFFKAIKPLQEAINADPQFVLARARLAEAWTELDYSDRAKDELLRIDVASTSNLSAMDRIRLAAIQNTIKRDYAAAVQNYQTLITMVPEDEKAYACLDLGRAYTKNQQRDQALESFSEAGRRNPNYGAAFLYQGLTYGRKRQYAEAYSAFDQAQKLFDITADQDGLVEVLLQRGVLLGQQGKVNDARGLLSQALQRAAALENKDKQIKALLSLSYSSQVAGDSSAAQQFSSQALDLAKVNGLENLTTGSLIEIGNTYFAKGNYTDADKYFSEALKWAEMYKGARNQARALLSLASLRTQQDDPDGALDFASRALPFYEQGGFATETAQAYAIKGRALNQTGQLEAARQIFVLQLETAEKVKDPSQTMSAHENLGLVLSDMQRYPEALLQFQEQQRIAESISNKLSGGYAIMNQGNMLWQLGRYEDGGKYFAWALNVLNSESPKNHDLLAWLNLFKAQMALSQRDFREAMERSKEAQTVGARLKHVLVRATFVFGLAKSLNGDRSGSELCEHAVELARALRDPRPLPEALLALSEAELKSGNAGAALVNATAAQQIFSNANQHESEWRTLAIQAQAQLVLKDQQSFFQLSSRAHKLLDGLETEWGKDHYQAYRARTDVSDLLKRLN
jgi:serine/threonine protein kinase